jgi:5-methylcytosine-specific restriction endonuclease McrA
VSKRLNGQARRNRLLALSARDGWCCHYCRVLLSLDDPRTSIDERKPLVRGGTKSHGNQVIACRDCNNDKADMTEAEYVAK